MKAVLNVEVAIESCPVLVNYCPQIINHVHLPYRRWFVSVKACVFMR